MIFVEEARAELYGFEIPIQCLRISTARPHISNKAHYHDYIEILYGTDSDAVVWHNGEETPLKTGDLIIINSKKPHEVYSKNGVSSYIVIKFMPQILYAAEQSVFEFKYIMPFLTDTGQYDNLFLKNELESSEIPAIMSDIMKEWDNKSYGYEIALRIYVNRIILWLLRNRNKEAVLPTESYATMSVIQKALEYAQKHFQDVDLNSVSEECGLSYSYFSRIFKRVMKRSFSEYVNYIRITEAQRLLASTEKSITEIAQDVGFSTASYFIDNFKKQVHTTPMQFRKNLGEK